jgi:hypothetical protein
LALASRSLFAEQKKDWELEWVIGSQGMPRFEFLGNVALEKTIGALTFRPDSSLAAASARWIPLFLTRMVLSRPASAITQAGRDF